MSHISPIADAGRDVCRGYFRSLTGGKLMSVQLHTWAARNLRAHRAFKFAFCTIQNAKQDL